MTRYAFDNPGGFSVRRDVYEPHAPHPFTTEGPGRRTLRRPLQVILRVQYEYKYHQAANDSFEIRVMGEISTLTYVTARKIGVPTTLIGGQALATKWDAYGRLVSGSLQSIRVFLGQSSRDIKFLVGVSPAERQRLQAANAGILSPEQNTLRLVDAFSEHLMCFDGERLYSFPDSTHQHRLSSKQTKTKKQIRAKGPR